MAQDELETRIIDNYTNFEEQTMEKIDKIFEEEIELTKNRISIRIKKELASSPRRIVKNGNQISSRRSMRLQFTNRISQPILTGEDIKGEGVTSIEVALFDDSTGNVVANGPEASATVAIVLLKGEPADASRRDDWTVEEFDNLIIREMEKPLLAGNLILKLERGVAVLEKITFKHHTTKMKPPVFRLGARIVETFDGVGVKEAKTESFTVKDFRGKYYKKYESPSLSDKVYHLVNIRKDGKIDKNLRDYKIETVEDLLIRLLIDPQGLRSIVTLGAKKWEATINNARACLSDKRMYCYINSEQKTGVVFNVLGQVLGLYLNSQYASINMLSEYQKADAQDLLASAYEHWENVKHFDDENSLQQYFADLRSNFPLQSTSPIDLIGEIGIDDMEFIGGGDLLQCSPHSTFNLESIHEDFDGVYQDQMDNYRMQLNGPIHGENPDDQIAVTFVETQVHISKPPKRWKKLLCVSRWFTIRKKVSIGRNHNRKAESLLISCT